MSDNLAAPDPPKIVASRLSDHAKIFVGYFVLAMVGLQLAIPPTIAAPVWPAASVSLLLVLSGGSRLLPALALASVASALCDTLLAGRPLDTTSILVFAAIAIGAVLRSWTGAKLLRPRVGSVPSIRSCGIVLFWGGAVACVISATIGTAALVVAGWVPVEMSVEGWLLWYIGDIVGLIILAPIWLGLRSVSSGERAVTVGLSLAVLVFGFVVAAFVFARSQAEAATDAELRATAGRVAKALQDRIDTQIVRLADVDAFLTHNELPSPATFERMVAAMLSPTDPTLALAFVELVNGSQLAGLVARERATVPEFRVHEPGGNGTARPGTLATRHAVVIRTAPIAVNRAALGLDAFKAETSATFEQALADGRMHVSQPVRLVQETGNQLGVVFASPVGDFAAGRVRGFAASVMRLGELFQTVAPVDNKLSVRVGLWDGDTWLAGSRVPEAVYSFALKVGGRDWNLRAAPLPGALAERQDFISWAFLVMGSLLTGLTGILLMVGRAVRAEIEHRVAEQTIELATARDRAIEASRVKSDFLGVMSHEIRTPLHGVIATINLLAGSEPDEHRRDRLVAAELSANGLLDVVSDVLEFVKGGHRPEATVIAPFVPSELCRGVVGTFAAAAKDKRLELISMWSFPDNVQVTGDARKLRQVLLNLLGNAVKFTGTGEVRVEAALTGDAPGPGRLCVRVVDTGIGIPAAALQQIFEPFVQVENGAHRNVEGTGLGLAIARRLCEQMKGTLVADSKPGHGTSFELCVPVNLQLAAITTSEPTPALRPVSVPAGAKILAVDDHPMNLSILSAMLSSLGFESIEAADGRAALELIQQHHDELYCVLMDGQMPEMDGYQATRALRAWEAEHGRRRLPVIAVTANAQEEAWDSAKQAGMDWFLTKPATVAMVASAIEAAVKEEGSN